jgi:hypothetical protein
MMKKCNQPFKSVKQQFTLIQKMWQNIAFLETKKGHFGALGE